MVKIKYTLVENLFSGPVFTLINPYDPIELWKVHIRTHFD